METGTSPVGRPVEFTHYDGTRPLRVLWSGVHQGRKALPILLQAMHRIRRQSPLHVTILGSGSNTAAWRKLARRLGLETELTWLGHVSQSEALAEMSRADLFAFTSLQEASSTVVMEALNFGIPVICHDTCGMSVAVTESCGIKIPVTNPEGSISAFAEAIARLAAHPEQLRDLSMGALCRAHDLTWEKGAARLAKGYQAVVEAHVLSLDK